MDPASEFPIHDDLLTGASPSVFTERAPSTVSFGPYHHPGRIGFILPVDPHNSAASSLLRGRVLTGLPRGGLASRDEDSGTAYQVSGESAARSEWVGEEQETASAWAMAMAHRPSPSQSPTTFTP